MKIKATIFKHLLPYELQLSSPEPANNRANGEIASLHQSQLINRANGEIDFSMKCDRHVNLKWHRCPQLAVGNLLMYGEGLLKTVVTIEDDFAASLPQTVKPSYSCACR